MTKIQVKKVARPRDTKKFINFPFFLYQNNPLWIPPLLLESKKELNRKKNIYFSHSEADFFLAYKDKNIVGRIGVFNNQVHRERYRENVGFFGMLEFINEIEILKALLDKAEAWCRGQGLTQIVGPVNFSPVRGTGCLVEGFDKLPAFDMNYNPPYYSQHLETLGYKKRNDLFAFDLEPPIYFPEDVLSKAEEVLSNPKVSIRHPDFSRYNQEMELVFNLFRKGYSQNWGLGSVIKEEFEIAAKAYNQFADPELMFIMSYEGKEVALGFSFPDINELFQKLRGRIIPRGLKLFFKKPKFKKIRILQIYLILEDYRGLGLDVALCVKTLKAFNKSQYQKGEIAWVIDENLPVLNFINRLGIKPTKTYRLYKKELGF